MFKALAAAAAITICCLGNEYPAKAELIYRTGPSIYGGNSYNHGKYRTDTLRSGPLGEVIRDRDNNRYRCNSIGRCRSY